MYVTRGRTWVQFLTVKQILYSIISEEWILEGK